MTWCCACIQSSRSFFYRFDTWVRLAANWWKSCNLTFSLHSMSSLFPKEIFFLALFLQVSWDVFFCQLVKHNCFWGYHVRLPRNDSPTFPCFLDVCFLLSLKKINDGFRVQAHSQIQPVATSYLYSISCLISNFNHNLLIFIFKIKRLNFIPMK